MATPFLRSDSSASPPSSDHSASRRRSPRKPSDEGWHELQDQRARKLTKTMRGDVVVEYDSTTILDDDRGSQGHAFRVGSHFDDDFQWFGVYIDSRQPLAQSLIDALRERAKFFTDMADRVAASQPKRKGGAQ